MEVYVECAGKEAGGSLSIDIPGARILSRTSSAGIHVVTLRPGRDKLSVLEHSRFDTFVDEKAEHQLAAYLRELLPGRIVVLGVCDTAVKRRGVLDGKLLEESLRLLGGSERRGFGPGCLSPLRRLNFREAWAFIGVRGAAPGSAGELKARSRNDALRIDAQVVHMTSGIPNLIVSHGKCWDVRDGAQLLMRVPTPCRINTASSQDRAKPADPPVTISLLDDTTLAKGRIDSTSSTNASGATDDLSSTNTSAALIQTPLLTNFEATAATSFAPSCTPQKTKSAVHVAEESASKRPRWSLSCRWINSPIELWQARTPAFVEA